MCKKCFIIHHIHSSQGGFVCDGKKYCTLLSMVIRTSVAMTMKINPVILCTQYSNVKSAVCLSSGTISLQTDFFVGFAAYRPSLNIYTRVFQRPMQAYWKHQLEADHVSCREEFSPVSRISRRLSYIRSTHILKKTAFFLWLNSRQYWQIVFHSIGERKASRDRKIISAIGSREIKISRNPWRHSLSLI